MVTAPVKLHTVVINCPFGQMGSIIEELDWLLSLFPEDGSPLVVFGDFSIHLEKPYAADLNLLILNDLAQVLTNQTTCST